MAHPQRVLTIFAAASELPPEQRGDYLNKACAGEPQLRAHVESLLQAHDQAGRFLAEPTLDAPHSSSAPSSTPGAPKPAPASHSSEAATVGHPVSQPPADEGLLRERPGTRIGPYKLLQLIGEGGFGSVFMAEQDEPVRRKVALKIIKLGMDTAQVVARFEQERQALAILDHPNIAKVFDAGATQTGRPYFVMELSTGEPIDAYCDRNNLSIPERIELLAQVCHAVQHAHTKGIIHRDIKPSNVLVSTQDGRAHAKVIDFGIAKATASRLTERTLFTEHRQLIGTPEYMSPEQAEGSLDIDTRTDVYALGVMLYELLTGSTPFTSKELRSAAYAEIQRIIREVEPPKPSTRLSQNAGTLASIAASRRSDPRKLNALVRGELDWIVMKALEKDRQRRYESANSLAADLRRYLSGEAVVAAPPSTLYRVRTFTRRHRPQVFAAALVALALVLGMIGTAWQARIASHRAELAQAAEARANIARDAEKARADELKRVSDFQEKMLAQINPKTAGASLTEDVVRRLTSAMEKANVPEAERAQELAAFRAQWARVNATDASAAHIDATILRPAVAAITSQFADQPLVQAQLRFALASVYHAIGLSDAALPLAQAAFDARVQHLGADHPDTLTSMDQVGLLRYTQGLYPECEAIWRDALARRRRVLGNTHPATLTSITNMGNVFLAQRKLAEAEPLFRESLEGRRTALGSDHPDTLASLGNMGVLYWSQNNLPEAERSYREAVEIKTRLLGREDPSTLNSLQNLGVALNLQAKRAEAEVIVRETLEIRRRVLGEAHPDTLDSIATLGPILAGQGKLDESEVFYREALELGRRINGAEHPDTLRALNNFGAMLLRKGDEAGAEACWRETLETSRRVLGPDHPDTIHRILNLGRVLVTQERSQEAFDLLAPAEPAARRVLTGGYTARLASYLRALAIARVGLGYDPERFAASEANLLEANTLLDGPNNAKDKDARACRQSLADLYAAWHSADPGKGYDTKAAEWTAKATAE